MKNESKMELFLLLFIDESGDCMLISRMNLMSWKLCVKSLIQ